MCLRLIHSFIPKHSSHLSDIWQEQKGYLIRTAKGGKVQDYEQIKELLVQATTLWGGTLGEHV